MLCNIFCPVHRISGFPVLNIYQISTTLKTADTSKTAGVLVANQIFQNDQRLRVGIKKDRN